MRSQIKISSPADGYISSDYVGCPNFLTLMDYRAELPTAIGEPLGTEKRAELPVAIGEPLGIVKSS